MWQQARQYLTQVRSPTLARLRTRLRLHSEVSPDVWKVGLGRLLGGLPRAAVEACFCPQSTGQGGAHPERYLLNPSRGRVFTGPGWDDVLVFPYFDVPGRICAFEFIGRAGAPADRVFRPQRTLTRSGSNQYAAQPAHRPEAGLAGLGTTDAAEAHWGRTVFAVGDVALAVRLQVRNATGSLRPLPLVCWHDGERALTRRAWRLLAGWPVVFWAWRLSPAVLYQAIQADGRLALAGPEELSARSLDHYVRLSPPLDLLRKLQRRARPWRAALRGWAEGQPDGAVEELLLGLGAYGLDVRRLARECGGGRLEELLPAEPLPRSVQVGARLVRERSDGWYYARRRGAEVQLLNAIVRIDVMAREGADLCYQGRILFRGEEVPFTAPAEALERRPARWLRAFLARAGKGVLHYAPGVTGLLEIALKFHEPRLE